MRFPAITPLIVFGMTLASSLAFAGDPVPSAPKKEPAKDTGAQKPTLDELKAKLSPEQYNVAVLCGTEPPFKNQYWDNHAAGIYVCIVSGKALFSSADKFDSGSGWPSFSRPIDAAMVEERVDSSHGTIRTEVRSAPGDSHLGHVFKDGPAPGGLRYCINSASLKFIPAAELEKQGYGQYKVLFEKK